MSCHIESLDSRRLFSAPALDTTFGHGGVVNSSFSVAEGDGIIASQTLAGPGGDVYVVAATGNTRQVNRVTADGSADATWGDHGALTFKIKKATNNAYFATDSAGRLDVLLGNAVYRFDNTGSLDKTFGTKGVITLDPSFTTVRKIVVDPFDRIWAVGSHFYPATENTADGYAAIYERILSRGRADTTFGTNGVYTVIDVNRGGNQKGYDVRVLPDASAVLMTQNTFDVFDTARSEWFTYGGATSVKLTGTGAVDKTYGRKGYSTLASAILDSRGHSEGAAVGLRGDGSMAVYLPADPSRGVFNTAVYTNGTNGLQRNQLDLLAANEPLDFIRQADGGDIVVNALAGRIDKIDAVGSQSSAFNTYFGSTSAALNADGTLTTAGQRGSNPATLKVTRIFRDEAPAATFIARPVTAAAGYAKFTVTFRDPDGINLDSVIGNSLRLRDEGGHTRAPRVVSTSVLANGEVVATYKVTDIAGNGFDATDDGLYAIRDVAGKIKDKLGNAMDARTIGSLTVAI